MKSAARKESAWWGEFELAEGQRGQWRIGPLDLWLESVPQEWRLVLERPRDPQDATLQVTVPTRRKPPESAAEAIRFAGIDPAVPAVLRPALADRAVVSRPERPFYIPAAARVTLYISTPLWIQLHLADKLLHELPAYQPSDTWFGANTIDGELCYATRTHCRLDLREVRWCPHRAVTPLTIHNAASDALLLERLNLPVPRLSLYADERNRLWTQAVELERKADRAMADVRIAEGPPAVAEQGTHINGPRQAGTRHFMARAFSALFQ